VPESIQPQKYPNRLGEDLIHLLTDPDIATDSRRNATHGLDIRNRACGALWVPIVIDDDLTAFAGKLFSLSMEVPGVPPYRFTL
jgi:hypothetical protein